MGTACVDCHNSHPESPKRDWKVGDVRGIQEIAIKRPIALSVGNLGALLIYFVFMASVGGFFILSQERQAAAIRLVNGQLAKANAFLGDISTKLSRYLAPQVYQSIFSGQKDVTVATERKKLTIFFSDIKDFTATTERMQPEELTRLLNEYLTEMAAIAHAHGGTIDKFIGDALLVFFGDPETKGEAEDARACLRMAVAMQRRLAELNVKWRSAGIEFPFQARMGINTGYCNVGNFGSAERVDYTIIGAETNLAARLQSIAEPGGIVVSYETFALVRDIAVGHALAPITMKGIARQVVPYTIDGMRDAAGNAMPVFAETGAGLALYLDLALVDRATADQVAGRLREALAALERKAD
jgi:class 3 adenylate cyclase